MHRELVERAMAGDHDAFSELARVSIGRLYAIARLILRDTDVPRTRPRRRSSSPGATSRRCAIPIASMPGSTACWSAPAIARPVAAGTAGPSRSRSTVDEPEPDADPGVDIADRDQLERGFRRLDADQRTVLVLHYYLGLTLDEAAEALGIPPGTVRSRLSRATRAMRAALDADARPPILNERRST